ncbi:hypothetical protein [Fusobacterium sp. IOR10]|uniref:hypothetical protein n=1 Tax=Fusobacterium sp. IOR10 TaxID=2665157 RepID=UPI00351A962E
MESKIIAVADSFDAMTSKRPYISNPLSLEQAIVELQKYNLIRQLFMYLSIRY